MSDPNVPGQQPPPQQPPPPPQQPPAPPPQQPPAPPPQQPPAPPPQQPPAQPAYPQQPQQPYPSQPGVPPQGYAAPGAPAAPPGSFGTYPTQPPPAQPSNKLKPIVVIGVLVAVMAVVGGGLALFGSSQDSEERSEVVPTGLPVLDPSQGPQPSEPIDPTPTPGPDPDPVVTTTTEAPEPEPEPEPDPDPGPGPGPSGDAVEVGGGVSVVPAPKWKLAAQEAGFVQLNAPSGDGNLYVSVYDESIGSEPIGVLTNYVENMVVPYVSELQTTEPEQLTGVGGNIVGAAKVEYAGVQAGQSGNIPVEGLILAFVRQDGTVVVYEEFNIAGAYEGLQPDYKSMLESVLATL
jgi:hypothetical protein